MDVTPRPKKSALWNIKTKKNYRRNPILYIPEPLTYIKLQLIPGMDPFVTNRKKHLDWNR